MEKREWGIGILVIGYALTVLTLAVRFLPLFETTEEKRATS